MKWFGAAAGYVGILFVLMVAIVFFASPLLLGQGLSTGTQSLHASIFVVSTYYLLLGFLPVYTLCALLIFTIISVSMKRYLAINVGIFLAHSGLVLWYLDNIDSSAFFLWGLFILASGLSSVFSWLLIPKRK